MMAWFKSRIKVIDNSFVILFPKEILRQNEIKEGEEVNVIITKRRNVLRETFGTHKFSRTTEQMMKETDEALYDI